MTAAGVGTWLQGSLGSLTSSPSARGHWPLNSTAPAPRLGAPAWPCLILQMKPEIRIFMCYLPILQCWQSPHILKNTVWAKLKTRPNGKGRALIGLWAASSPLLVYVVETTRSTQHPAFFSVKLKCSWTVGNSTSLFILVQKYVNMQTIRVHILIFITHI